MPIHPFTDSVLQQLLHNLQEGQAKLKYAGTQTVRTFHFKDAATMKAIEKKLDQLIVRVRLVIKPEYKNVCYT